MYPFHPPPLRVHRIPQVLEEHRIALLAVARSLYDHLQHLAELSPAARTVQRAYRSHRGRGILALSRHQVVHPEHGVQLGLLETYFLEDLCSVGLSRRQFWYCR